MVDNIGTCPGGWVGAAGLTVIIGLASVQLTLNCQLELSLAKTNFENGHT